MEIQRNVFLTIIESDVRSIWILVRMVMRWKTQCQNTWNAYSNYPCELSDLLIGGLVGLWTRKLV